MSGFVEPRAELDAASLGFEAWQHKSWRTQIVAQKSVNSVLEARALSFDST